MAFGGVKSLNGSVEAFECWSMRALERLIAAEKARWMEVIEL